MAITPFILQLIAPHAANGTVLSFGYPDLLMTRELASEIIGKPLRMQAPNGASHKLGFPLAHTDEVFDAIGARFRCIDIASRRGAEDYADLNEPQRFSEHDLVIDAGTTEHCANVGQAIMNGANAVAPGGWIFHSPPLSMVNHGFFNVCPTLLVDFYAQNGWMVEHLSAFKVKYPYEPAMVAANVRFAAAPDLCLCFLAQRTNDAPLKWPVQSKYLVH